VIIFLNCMINIIKEYMFLRIIMAISLLKTVKRVKCAFFK